MTAYEGWQRLRSGKRQWKYSGGHERVEERFTKEAFTR
jgi:hypothetical protein